MIGSGVLEKTRKVADKMAMGVINAIAGTRAANSGSVDGVTDDVLRPSKGCKCPPHLLKRTADKEVNDESVSTNEEAEVAKK